MSKKQGKLVIDSQFKEIIKDSYIILDTNILIGVGLQKAPYIDLFSLMDKRNCLYLTIDLCEYEFLKGSETSNELKIKKSLFKNFDINIFPTAQLKKDFNNILSIYRRSSKSISLADLYLAAMLIKYKNNKNLFLLSEDVKDFWGNFFDRKVILNIEEDKKIKPLVFSQLNSKSYVKARKTY